MYVSEQARAEVLRRRMGGERQYHIAKRAHLHPTVLSAMLNRMWPIEPTDARVIRLAGVLGLTPEACCAPEHGE